MTDVLIRDLPEELLAPIRAEATERGTSMQQQLHGAVAGYSVWLRRQAALRRTEERLAGRPGVTEDDRAAVLEAMKDESEITPVNAAHDLDR